jgi:hypothetical protein
MGWVTQTGYKVIRFTARSSGRGPGGHEFVALDARGDSHSAVVGGVDANHFSVALDVDVSGGNDLLRQGQHEIDLAAFFESRVGVKIKSAITHVTCLRFKLGTVVVARQNAYWQ